MKVKKLEMGNIVQKVWKLLLPVFESLLLFSTLAELLLGGAVVYIQYNYTSVKTILYD